MDTNYSAFANAHPRFYDAPSRAVAATGRCFVVPADLDWSGWDHLVERPWSFWRPRGSVLPEQGWKMHVGATLETADRMLREAAAFCHRRGIAFKFLVDQGQLERSLSKDADRSSAGKFLTVYPPDERSLHEALVQLDERLGGAPAPYILSDLRWREGPLFVRYGAFVKRWATIDGVPVLAVRDLDTGRWRPDVRSAAFQVPTWVRMPGFLREQLGALDLTPPAGLPTITGALHHSNAGGVYEATVGGASVIVKEARPHTGRTPDGRDAVTRLRDEEHVLRELASLPTPDVVDVFEAHGHRFLAMERIDGTPLNAAVVARHPLVRTGADAASRAEYRDWALTVSAAVRRAISQLHAAGFVHGDLHPGNVMVRADDSVVLIDLEMARDVSAPDSAGIGVPGFVPPDGRGGTARDLYALACIDLFVFLPLTALLPLDDAKAAQLISAAAAEFSLDSAWVERSAGALALRDRDRAPRSIHDPAETTDAALSRTIDGVVAALRADLDLGRDDRLWPGDPAQFAEPATGVAHGALGVMSALRLAGHDDLALERAWVERALAREQAPRAGLMDGAAGSAWAFRLLGDRSAAQRAAAWLAADELSGLGSDLYSGLPGVGLAFLAESDESPAMLDAAVRIADDLRNRLADAAPQTRVATGRGGLLHGATGTALFAVRLYERTGDVRHLRLASDALDHDMASLTRSTDASLQVNEGWRVLPYLGHGSAGIGAVIALALAHLGESERHLESLDGIVRAASAPFAIQSGLVQGRAGLMQFLLLLEAVGRSDTMSTEALHRHAAQLPLHSLSSPDGIRFVGNGLLRASCDLATGSAGVLTALVAYRAHLRGETPVLLGLPYLLSPRDIEMRSLRRRPSQRGR